MVERLLQVGSELLAVLSNGHLLAATINSLAWRHILSEVENVTAISVAVL